MQDDSGRIRVSNYAAKMRNAKCKKKKSGDVARKKIAAQKVSERSSRFEASVVAFFFSGAFRSLTFFSFR